MPNVQKTTGVPDNKVDEVMQKQKLAGATKVEKQKENGTWTVIATFPN